MGIVMYAITLRIIIQLRPDEVPQAAAVPWSERFR